MEKSKPIYSLNVYGSFGLRLDKEAVEHRRRLTKNLIKPPLQWDLVKEGLDLFQVRTLRKYVQLEAEQERVKLDVKMQKKLNESRLQEVHELLEKNLHQQFIEINAFVRDCTEKEKKASQKMDEELKKQQAITHNIQVLEGDLEKLINFKGTIEESVNEFKSFEDTVAQLVEEAEHLNTTKDFMDKCDALMMAQVEISDMEKQKVEEIGEFQKRLVNLSNHSETEFLGLNNFLVDLDKAYEHGQSQGVKWEQVLVKSRDVIVDEETKFTRLIDSARQLYLLICKRNGKDPNLHKMSIEVQLDYIKDEIEILVDVLATATECMHQEEKSLLGEHGTGAF